jgi:hypothetical protein
VGGYRAIFEEAACLNNKSIDEMAVAVIARAFSPIIRGKFRP